MYMVLAAALAMGLGGNAIPASVGVTPAVAGATHAKPATAPPPKAGPAAPQGDHGRGPEEGKIPPGPGFARPGFGILYTLGFGSTHSRQTSTYLHTELQLGWNREKWETALEFRAVGSWLNGNANSEEYFGKARANYLFTGRSYVWGWVGYRYNRFNAYQYQANEIVGYGYKAINTNYRVLRFEIGAGAGQDKLRQGGRKRSGVSEMAREIYAQHIGLAGHGFFEQAITLIHYPNNLFSEFSLRFVQPIGGGWSFWAGYRLEHNSESPFPDTVQTTSWITLNIGYQFGAPMFGS